MAAKTPPGLRVTPSVDGDGVIRCECGGRMDVSTYLSVPRYDRWLFYRCSRNSSHVTAALPQK